MTDDIDRREMLRAVGAGIAITGWYTGSASASSRPGGDSVSRDLVVTNNSDRAHRIDLEIYESDDRARRVLKRTLQLNGFNEADTTANGFKFEGKLEATGVGEYLVVASLVEGGSVVDEDTTIATLTPDGIAPGVDINVCVDLSDDLRTFLAG